MNEDASELIIGDAVVAAVEESAPPRRRWFRKTDTPQEPQTACENCGTTLTGAYCSSCGQHAIDYRRSLIRVLADAADSFLNWDAKFLKSLGVLVITPWRLTNDFNAGRRVRFVHPLRLYLLASIAFFLLAKLLNITPGTPGQLSPENRAELDRSLSQLSGATSMLNEEQRLRIDSLHTRLNGPEAAHDAHEKAVLENLAGKLPRFARKKALKPEDVTKLEAVLNAVPPQPPLPVSGSEPPPLTMDQSAPAAAVSTATPSVNFRPGIHFDGKSDSPLGTWLEARAKEKLGADGTKSQLFLETFRSNVPSMMLCCVPLFALILKLLYVRRRRFYVEHLVYALHIHTFIYVAVVVVTLVKLGSEKILPAPIQVLLVVALAVTAAAQVFISIRRVYGQGWIMTTLKFLLGGFIYSFVITAGLIATIVVTLLLP